MRDPVWQFVGVIVSGVALVITLVIAWRQNRNKRLAYSLRSSTVVGPRPELTDKLRFIYEAREVKDVRLLKILIQNTGSVPVTPDDFIEPFTFELEDQARILSITQVEARPRDLITTLVSLNADDGRARLILPPLLLNPSDKLEFAVLVTGGNVAHVKARVTGVRRVEKIHLYPLRDVLRYSATAFAIGAIIPIAAFAITSRLAVRPFIALTGSLIAGLTFLVVIVLRYFRRASSDQ